jgi:hypothetical protein
LAGSLTHLAPAALLRLLSATAPSGVLELTTDAGDLRIETAHGRVVMPSPDELERAGRILRSATGSFRFAPREVRPIEGRSLTLNALADCAETTEQVWQAVQSGDVDIDRLFAGEILELSKPAPAANIHVLSPQPVGNPLGELLNDLERNAPGELLLTTVGVVAHDPRMWRGTLASEWRRRGWELRVVDEPSEIAVTSVDGLLLHREEAFARAAVEDEWIALVEEAAATSPPVPVVWVGRLRDPRWLHRLIGAGVSFIMPAPATPSARAIARLGDDLAAVLDRHIATRQLLAAAQRPTTVYELVDTLLEGGDSDEAVGSLLQLASTRLQRGAVLMVEETAIRCRAGYGYPLNRQATALPRGVALLERVVRSGEAVIGLDADSGAALHLARVLGLERLPAETAVIPLGAGARVVGLLVADREGEPLPELREITLLACCLGGAVVRGTGTTSQL